MTPHAISLRSLIAVLLLTSTACGSTDTGSSASSSAPSPVPSSAPPSSAPTTVAKPVTTEPAVTETTEAEPEIIDSVTAAAPTTPGDGSSVEPVTEELRDGVPTVKGTTYSIIDPTSKTGVSFVSTVDGAYPFLVGGAVSLSRDEAALEGLITVLALDRMRTFIEPIVDVVQIPPDAIAGLTEPVAADYLAWFGGLPAVTVGPIAETTVDGHPARSMTYAFGPTPNGLPCDATSAAGCIAVLWNPGGSILIYAGGDTGTLYDVVVDGKRALVDVTTRPGAQEIFETLHFLPGDEG